MTTQKIRVLVVDDSLSMRLFLKKIIDATADMKVVATAADPLQAEQILTETEVDVMTLDVEMPHQSGIAFLQQVMAKRPLPVVMVSTLTSKGSATALQALELGAVDVVGKPSARAEEILEAAAELTHKLRAAACAQVGGRSVRPLPAVPAVNTAGNTATERVVMVDEVLPPSAKPTPTNRPPLVAIGASTGGPQALQRILPALQATAPPVVVAQHMSVGFIAPFAKRLDGLCKVRVHEAVDGMPILPGHVYFAPAKRHLLVRYGHDRYFCEVLEAPAVNRFHPSVDVLFRSVAHAAGAQGIGILLTGMGDDGAKCLGDMRRCGAHTIAQDEASSVVYGMPRVAVKLGSAASQQSLEEITAFMANL